MFTSAVYGDVWRFARITCLENRRGYPKATSAKKLSNFNKLDGAELK